MQPENLKKQIAAIKANDDKKGWNEHPRNGFNLEKKESYREQMFRKAKEAPSEHFIAVRKSTDNSASHHYNK